MDHFAYKAGCWGSCTREDTEYGPFLSGTVTTPFGLVDVYSENQTCRNGRVNKYTTYSFVVGGRKHHFTEQKFRTSTGLARIAHRLIREVANTDCTRKEDASART